MKSRLVESITAILITLPTLSWAETYEFHNESYKAAKKSDTFVRFDMSSTKLGLLTTSFTGFVKNFTLSGELKNNSVAPGSTLEFSVNELDTDVDSRNEKMWDYCLNFKEHPKIRITLNEGLQINGPVKQISASLRIRGTEKPIMLNVKIQQLENESFVVDLDGDLSLKKLEIPDPSIAIASVKDNIAVKSHLIVKSK